MARLRIEKLHVHFLPGSTPEGPLLPRRYTLTHSDRTGDLFLTIGPDYNRKQIRGLYARFLRDEALAEWVEEEKGLVLKAYVHVSGGLVLGTPAWRNRILKKELPLVFQAIRAGDAHLVKLHPHLDEALVEVHFESDKVKYHRVEPYGIFGDYLVTQAT